jgi:phasin family protein
MSMTAARTATGRTAKVAEGANAAFEQATAASREAFRENVDRSLAAMSELSAFSKQNIEAVIASATATQKGMEALSARAVAFSKTAMENHVAAAKSLMTSKSVQEFVEKQTEYARSSFDAYMAELNNISDVWAGVAKSAMQPINERVGAVTEFIQSGAAR